MLPLERMCALNQWKIMGEFLISGVLHVSDMDRTDGCCFG